MFHAGSQGKKMSASFVAVFFILFHASVLLAQPRAPHSCMPSGVSSYLLVADMSNDSVYTATATNRSRHRAAAGFGDFAEYGVPLLETAGIPGEGIRFSAHVCVAQDFGYAPEARFDVASRK
ncbi:MAG: hypothetical protein LBF92_04870 [Synergistaceae bacterium]|jgi:hypothetical protein|nr:hypothetical protein [Synergistaceae bacterium]